MTVAPEQLAARLRGAYGSGAVAPLRDGLDPVDAERAYAVQAINTRHWLAEGRRLVGRKIGLTAVAVQQQLGVDQPDYGALFADMRIEDGGTVDPARLLQPKAEAEVAFVLARDVDDPQVSAAHLAASIDHAVAAIEIVDSRIADWRISFADTVADNGSAAFFALGREAKKLEGLDLYSCGMVLERNGEPVSLGAGAACLGHPLNAAAWLARTMAATDMPLRAGDILLTGALGPMVPLAAGERLVAHVGGLGSVSIECGPAR